MIQESAWDRYDFQHDWDVVILLWVDLSLIWWMWAGYGHWHQDHRVGPGTVQFTNKDATIVISCMLLPKMHRPIDVLRGTAPHPPCRVPHIIPLRKLSSIFGNTTNNWPLPHHFPSFRTPFTTPLETLSYIQHWIVIAAVSAYSFSPGPL